MDRRRFIRACTAVAAASLASPSFFLKTVDAKEGSFKPYKRAPLVDEDGKSLKLEKINPSREYLFFYPYRATPCILIDMDRELPPVEVKLADGSTYRWQGGVGPKKSIVAYSAICPHQLSHPTPDYSFINYYPEDKPSKVVNRGGVIQCCAHMSVFDPRNGGTVLEGPAKFPLLAIVLEYEDGVLYAVGTLGKELFEEFFDVFKPDLKKLYRSTRRAKKLVEKCPVVEMSEYTKEVIRC